jgi:hypothetical protein
MDNAQNTFVLSEDIGLLMKQWSREKNRKIPDQDYFKDNTVLLMDLLQTLFSSVILAEARNIVDFLSGCIGKNDFVISMDRAYTPFLKKAKNIITLDDCRAFNLDNQFIRAERPEKQIAVDLKKDGLKNITLVDDVIFDGKSISQVIDKLSPLKVNKIAVGITTRAGKKKIEEAYGIPVEAAYTFDNLLDEVCERDFIAGTPLCGRPVYVDQQRPFFLGSKPYVLPYGDPVNWASIPAESAARFSESCCTVSAKLWQDVGQLNRMDICNRDLPRMVFGMDYNMRVTTALKNNL